MVKVFVPRERAEGETRVAATPETVKRLVKEGLSVKIEAGAGERAHLSDAAYEQAGATSSKSPASPPHSLKPMPSLRSASRPRAPRAMRRISSAKGRSSLASPRRIKTPRRSKSFAIAR